MPYPTGIHTQNDENYTERYKGSRLVRALTSEKQFGAGFFWLLQHILGSLIPIVHGWLFLSFRIQYRILSANMAYSGSTHYVWLAHYCRTTTHSVQQSVRSLQQVFVDRIPLFVL